MTTMNAINNDNASLEKSDAENTGSENQIQASQVAYTAKRSKTVATLLALLLGAVGLHKFYHGSWGWGLVCVCILVSAEFLPGYDNMLSQQRYAIVLQIKEDAKYYARQHIKTEHVAILYSYFSNWDSWQGERQDKGWVDRDTKWIYSDGREPTRAEINHVEAQVDNLVEIGKRQSPAYEALKKKDAAIKFIAPITDTLKRLPALPVCFLAAIGIIDGITYWRMSKERYHTRYNETPRRAFKW